MIRINLRVTAGETAYFKEGPMLVLSRKLGESIYIGDNIKITIVDIDRGKIRVGVQAPRGIGVFREELIPTEEVQKIETNMRDSGTERSPGGSNIPKES